MRQLKPKEIYIDTRSPGGGILENSGVCSVYLLLCDSVSLGGPCETCSSLMSLVRTGMLQFSVSLRENVFSLSLLIPQEHFIFQSSLIKQLNQLISWGGKTQLRFLMKFSCGTGGIYTFFSYIKVYSCSAWIIHHEWTMWAFDLICVYVCFLNNKWAFVMRLVDTYWVCFSLVHGELGAAEDVLAFLSPVAKLWLDT